MEATLFSGQSFFWNRTADGYVGAVAENAAALHRDGGAWRLVWEGEADAPFWRAYFDLDRDYGRIAGLYRGDSLVQTAFSNQNGLRVLQQPVWETLIGAMISANNNDRRIRKNVASLASAYGQARRIEQTEVMLFPRAQALACVQEEALRAQGLGYRAAYVRETARRVADGFDLEGLRQADYETALARLRTLPGVGEKVADCVLLFSCGFTQAFPVDVWIARVMENGYGMRGTRHGIKRQSLALFGDYAGIVQQVLFHSARCGGLKGIGSKAPRPGQTSPVDAGSV